MEVKQGVISANHRLTTSLEDLRQYAEAFDAAHEIRNPHIESAVTSATKSVAKPSSVLMLITDEPVPQVMLNRRDAGIRFGGHLCFPGGRAEAGETVIETALRESEEEIGLDRNQVEVLGSFGHYFSQAGYRIDPVVGIVPPNIEYRPDPSEVAEIHWIPFHDMLDPACYGLTYMNPTRGYFGFDTDEIHVGGPTVSLMIGLLEWLGER